MVALASVAGCSLALSGPDARAPKTKTPECDSGKGLVTLDIVTGSILGTAALVALSENESSAGLVTGLLATAYIAAAIHGNTNVNECRTALAAYNTRPYETPVDEPEVATRPRTRPTGPQPELPPTYVEPQVPGPQPPVTVVPPPVAVKTPPPWKEPKGTPPKPAPAPEAPADWREFWTEVP